MTHLQQPQISPAHAGLRCLVLIARHHGQEVAPALLNKIDEAHALPSLLRIARLIPLKTKKLTNQRWEHISKLGSAYPVLTCTKDGGFRIVVGTVPQPNGSLAAAVLDPLNESAGITAVPSTEFVADWDGTIVLFRREGGEEERRSFGLGWFLPEIMRHRSDLRDIAIAAVMANAIAFGTPLLFNIIIDKVIPHQSYNTLYFIIGVFMIITVFDAAFGYIRQRLMLLATNKIDARLSSQVFNHLLSLPLPFFEGMSAGVLLRHVQQTEKIRHFLTGRLFQMMLDLVFLPVLLVLLTFYSGLLTAVVLGFSAAIAVVIALMLPTYRRRMDALYQAEGSRQALLIETIHGVRTVKSLALENSQQVTWDSRTVQSIKRQESVGTLGAVGGTITRSIEKLMQVAVLGIGAVHVFDGSLTIGALVAFNMLSARVSGPLVQMVSLINEYQETALSVRMLGHVMDHPPEREPGRHGLQPEITGEIVFDDVTFSYQGARSPALDGVSFAVKEGQVIGVVGRSGSGKTTITRLIQGIQTPQAGVIRVDGVDIRNIDLQHLRRHVGIVLQDNFLFHGSLRDNIAAAKPNATLAEITEAVRMAGADEFIERLPYSYDTRVEEGGTNFSGGQRQRIAIARALLAKPRLLIFDEATSALDPESEAIIQENLERIAEGRTMIIVSHRLSSLVQADSIMVLDRGKLVDFAPHSVLVERCEIYRHLWHQQTRHVQ